MIQWTLPECGGGGGPERTHQSGERVQRHGGSEKTPSFPYAWPLGRGGSESGHEARKEIGTFSLFFFSFSKNLILQLSQGSNF